MKVTATQYNLNAAINKAYSAKQDVPTISHRATVDPVLGNAKSQLASLPYIDMAHVAEMKDAISSGKIAINLDSLTDAMQKYFQR
ncbi:flagellar biosynthesis anti-sigma factor FlgM [Citrobacter portucalensis]|uniref:flagellar biosynthesis anti-sigma factor FlgM n=1 Tax=Citrobacter portucalensis TaxID=1639133 RepID=UPI003CFA6F9C